VFQIVSKDLRGDFNGSILRVELNAGVA
jgi:hypothetical protein